MIGLLPLITSAALSILGGGLLGVWLTHRRLSPKSRAEAREITAAAMDRDWTRFHREIDRLVKRLESAEEAADKARREAEIALGKLHDCEEREIKLKAEIARVEGLMFGIGEGRQRTAAIVAADRLDERAKR